METPPALIQNKFQDEVGTFYNALLFCSLPPETPQKRIAAVFSFHKKERTFHIGSQSEAAILEQLEISGDITLNKRNDHVTFLFLLFIKEEKKMIIRRYEIAV